MTETLVVVEPPSKQPEQRPPSAELDAARELGSLARHPNVIDPKTYRWAAYSALH